MDIVTYPMPPDVAYFLDSALEHGELDAGSHVVLNLYAPRGDLMRIVDRDYKHDGQPSIAPRLSICGDLTAYAGRIIDRLSPSKRGAIALAGLQHIKGEVQSLAWCMATWAIEDEIKGGCLKPFHRRWTRFGARYELSPKQHRRLYGPNWVRHYVKTNDDSRSLRKKGFMACGRLAGIEISDVRAAANEITMAIEAQHEGFRRHNERAIHAMAICGQKLDRAATRKRRRIIKRATICAKSILPHGMLSDFVAGRSVMLDGETLALEVARVGSCASLGHAGLSVTAVDLRTRKRLASLCVYHEKTPSLDQLTALALAMQSGEESDIIHTANLSRVTDLGLAHPLIAERGRAHMERPWRPRDERAEKNEAYWLETKPLWIATLGVFVLGRMWSVV